MYNSPVRFVYIITYTVYTSLCHYRTNDVPTLSYILVAFSYNATTMEPQLSELIGGKGARIIESM